MSAASESLIARYCLDATVARHFMVEHIDQERRVLGHDAPEEVESEES